MLDQGSCDDVNMFYPAAKKQEERVREPPKGPGPPAAFRQRCPAPHSGRTPRPLRPLRKKVSASRNLLHESCRVPEICIYIYILYILHICTDIETCTYMHYCVVLHFIALHCVAVSYHIVLNRIVLSSTYCIVLCCCPFYCVASCCSALWCILCS